MALMTLMAYREQMPASLFSRQLVRAGLARSFLSVDSTAEQRAATTKCERKVRSKYAVERKNRHAPGKNQPCGAVVGLPRNKRQEGSQDIRERRSTAWPGMAWLFGWNGGKACLSAYLFFLCFFFCLSACLAWLFLACSLCTTCIFVHAALHVGCNFSCSPFPPLRWPFAHYLLFGLSAQAKIGGPCWMPLPVLCLSTEGAMRNEEGSQKSGNSRRGKGDTHSRNGQAREAGKTGRSGPGQSQGRGKGGFNERCKEGAVIS